MNLKINKEEISKRKNTLEKTTKFLKAQFIGIDNIIDDLMEYIQVWYLMPEILNRPVIVNLWGMTGVGKTDLVRKMVKQLDFQDRFIEIELSNTDDTSWNKSVVDVFNKNKMNDEKPSIVLFDEIQRFNTIDPNGMPVPQTKYTDFWELLSDGRLSKKEKDDIEHYLFSYIFRKKENERRKANGEREVEEKPLLNMWDAKELKNFLGLDKDVMDLAELTEDDMIKMILSAQQKKKIYEAVDYSKMLIIISGNLDEAFRMSGQTSEADVDADIFHAFTKKITMVDIKNALTQKFRPEQVARFGNIHLIYNSLKKSDFQKLIEREISRLKKETKNKFGITLKVGSNINQLIYRNGVFPVQGVRPVFSSVMDILDSNLSKLIFNAIMEDESSIEIDYSENEKKIVGKTGKTKIEIPYVGRIDKIRQSNVADAVANISVHECGHAVAYMHLTGMVPLQLKSKIASSYAGGFTFPHQIHETKENLLDKIKIFLAGGIAEEIIFGAENASVGRSADRESATILVLDYLRYYGFDESYQITYNMESYPHRMGQNITDKKAEEMMQTLVKETRELLIKHLDLLKELSTDLCVKGSMEPNEVVRIAKKHQLNVLVKPEGHLHIATYNDKLNP